MADVRGASGVPPVGAFGGIRASTPSTPIYVNLDNGDLYALISNAVTRLTGAGVATGLSAAGTTQGTATSATAALNVFTTVAAGTGAVLTAGPVQTIYNGGANVLKIYPPSGAKINNLAINAAVSLAVNTTCTFLYASSTQWIGNLSA